MVILEGRDAAGKGGVIKRIAERTEPALLPRGRAAGADEREQTQWYFQRYVAHLPAAGEIVLFDRSWYNRAGVERVMGFCTAAEYEEFMRSLPGSSGSSCARGIQLVKYWFSVSDEPSEERRFQARAKDPMRRWRAEPDGRESRAALGGVLACEGRGDPLHGHQACALVGVIEADDKRHAAPSDRQDQPKVKANAETPGVKRQAQDVVAVAREVGERVEPLPVTRTRGRRDAHADVAVPPSTR